jgi:oligoribonuclease (3'-5' exoribonuclease)
MHEGPVETADLLKPTKDIICYSAIHEGFLVETKHNCRLHTIFHSRASLLDVSYLKELTLLHLPIYEKVIKQLGARFL